MRVLVTGASGFIGAALCRRLVARGDEVHGTRRHREVPQGATAHTVDLGDRAAVAALIEAVEPEGIVHLAGHVSGGRGPDASPEALRVTLGSTVHLLEAAARPSVPRTLQRLVIAGSLEEPSSGTVPSSPYGVAKESARLWARLAYSHWQVPVVWARLFMVYGAGQSDWDKLVPSVCRALLRGEAPRCSSGSRPVDWIYIGDVVDGLLACLDGEGLEGAEVELGTGALVTVRDLVERLHALVPGAPAPIFGALPDRPHEVVRAAETTSSHQLLEWAPRVGLEQGLAATLEWVRRVESEAGP